MRFWICRSGSGVWSCASVTGDAAENSPINTGSAKIRSVIDIGAPSEFQPRQRKRRQDRPSRRVELTPTFGKLRHTLGDSQSLGLMTTVKFEDCGPFLNIGTVVTHADLGSDLMRAEAGAPSSLSQL